MRKLKKKQFKAMGFIEVLVAIVVVGIVSAVFLSIAGNAMKDLIQAERIEYMARLARNGVNVAQEIANKEKANVVTTTETNYFPDNTYCYIPLREGEGEDVVYSFEKEGEGNTLKWFENDNSATNRENVVAYVTEFVSDTSSLGGEDYFVVMCIEYIDTETTQWANVKFWVGDTKVAGVRTDSSDVKDFIYYAVIEL